MNIIVLSGSPRKGGNTDLLAESFAKGATEKGHKVETVSVHDYEVAPCKGCNACFRTANNTCVQVDDMTAIYQKMKQMIFAIGLKLPGQKQQYKRRRYDPCSSSHRHEI